MYTVLWGVYWVSKDHFVGLIGLKNESYRTAWLLNGLGLSVNMRKDFMSNKIVNFGTENGGGGYIPFCAAVCLLF